MHLQVLDRYQCQLESFFVFRTNTKYSQIHAFLHEIPSKSHLYPAKTHQIAKFPPSFHPLPVSHPLVSVYKMSATSTGLSVLGDPVLLDIFLTIISIPVVLIFAVVENMREIMGCDVLMVLLVLVVYDVYHMMVFSLKQGVLMWLGTVTGMYLLEVTCELYPTDVVMMTQVDLDANSGR